MAESKKGEKRKDPEIAAVEWLMEESAPAEAARPRAPVVVPTDGEGFDLAEPATKSDDASPARPVVPLPPPTVRQRTRTALPPAPAVEQVWSRMAEWGTSLAILAAWAVLVLWLLYLCVGAEAYMLAALVFGLGCVVGLVLLYPMIITLERPVRMTPEQAARDYFHALSHHVPHYRRMWLLLSARGKRSAEFTSYDTFKGYWKAQLAQLRDGHAGAFTPLVFQVDDFRAEKSAGRTDIEGKFQLRVYVRGRRDKGPIWSFPLERTFARGPDNMWYLDDGSLVRQDKEPESST